MLPINFKLKNFLIAVLIIAYVAWFFLYNQLPDKKFHIYFLNVGQGDAIFIKTPENQQILIDGGPNNLILEELAEVLPFFDKSIDLVVLTHPQSDHIKGLTEVIKRYEIGQILFTGINYDGANYENFLAEIDKMQIPIILADSKTDFLAGEILLDIVYPQKQIAGKKFKEVNNSSIAMRIIYKNKVILLTGDLEAEAENFLIANNISLKADILKAGHHGSKTSSALPFLQKVKPEIVIIQSGKTNPYGHPHEETLKNFEEVGVKRVYRNDIDGRVEFVF